MINIHKLNKGYDRKNINEDIVIGYSALRISLPLFVAVEKKFFEKENIRVKLKRFDTAQPLINALLSGNIQAGGYSALPISLRGTIQKKIDLYYITSLLESFDNRISYFLASNHNQYTNWENVRGKKIGILPTIAYESWIREILKNKGISEDQVNIIPIEPMEQLDALKNSSIDFLFTNDPVATTIIQKNIGRCFSDEIELPKIFGSPYIFGSFNIRKDFADNNPLITKKISEAMDNAIDFLNKNPKSAKKIMKKYVHESQIHFVDFYPEGLYKNNKQTTPKLFQDIIDQYFGLEIISKNFNARDLLFSERNDLESFSNGKEKRIFNDFSLKINKGTIIGLFGPNGSGKSTLLGIIAGSDKKYSGDVSVYSKKISFVHQKPKETLLPWFSCKENILLALDYHDLDRSKGEDLLDYLSEKLKIDFSLYSYPFELSGGQQQIVAIVRALIIKPEILLLDEPFASLDVERRTNVLAILKENFIENMTVIICSHRGDEISSILDRAVVLQHQPVKITKDSLAQDMSRKDFEDMVSKIRFQKNDEV